MSQTRATLLNPWVSVPLILVRIGFVFNYTQGSSLTTFLVNFFAIVPLSIQAKYATAEFILRIGENWGGLAYITIRQVSHN